MNKCINILAGFLGLCLIFIPAQILLVQSWVFVGAAFALELPTFEEVRASWSIGTYLGVWTALIASVVGNLFDDR